MTRNECEEVLTRRRSASKKAMKRFARYWIRRDTKDILNALGMFTPKEDGKETTLPESPERRKHPTRAFMQRGKIIQLRLEEMEVVPVAGPSTRRRTTAQSSEYEYVSSDES